VRQQLPIDHESVGQRLKRLRLERGLSQRELATPGVSYAYISRIEAGTRQPSVKALRKLARQLDVSTEYLETGRDIDDSGERELKIVDAELALRLGDPIAAESSLWELFDTALAAGDRPHAARARIDLALTASDRGDHAAAVAGFEEAFVLERPSPLERLDVFATLGRAYGALGQTEREIELYRRCLDDVSEIAPENAVARTRYRILLSYALSDAGALARAEDVVRDALRESPIDGDPYMRIRLFWSLARLSEMEGHSSRALRYARRAIALLEATEDEIHCGRAYVLAAWIMNSAGDGEGAQAQLDRAEELLGQGGSVDDIAMLNVERARAAALVGNGAEAIRIARNVLEVLADQYDALRGTALWALAEGLVLEQDPDEATKVFSEAVELLATNRRWREASQACRSWGGALRAAGKADEAFDVLERASDLALRAAPADSRVAGA
jgi:transcriptional regulator with XRE-family HTH domain